jgi:IclR family pca regulon transcriptional regulator
VAARASGDDVDMDEIAVSAEVDGTTSKHRDFVQSLDRGLAIIRVFDADRPRLTVSEIAQVAGLTRAAVRRFLFTLTELGYVQPRRDGYELTPKVLELGYSYLSSLTFPEAALPHLEKLVTETGEASEGSILDRGDLVYVVRVPGPALMTISVSVGARRPAYATAMGRALLANLPPAKLDAYLETVRLEPLLPNTITDTQELREELARVREQGFALVNQELEVGLVAVGVPVRDRRAHTRAAINLSTHIGRKTIEEMLALVPRVQQAAADIELGLRHAVSWSD